MRYALVPCLALLLFGACNKSSEEVKPQAPEYADTAEWYVLKAPDERSIEAVAGDIDGTLIITTAFHVYQSKDAGKTWQESNYRANLGVMGFGMAQDTLLALTTTTGVGSPASNTYAFQPSFASLDQGATWVRYVDRRDDPREFRVCRNRVQAPSGTDYSIEYLLTPISPNASTNYVETVGITTSTGRKLYLPYGAAITSLAFDRKSRLYVTASGALCGQRDKFAYCGSSNGVLYVSKKPQL